MNLTVGLAGSGADRIISGTAEDEITRAAADVGASGGGTVTILSGVYELASGIVVTDDNVQLRGAGAGQTVLKARPDFQIITFAAIAFHGADHFVVDGITVDATDIPWLGGAAATNGVAALQCVDGIVRKCEVLLSQNWSYGIWARQSDSIRILNNEVDGGVQTRSQEGIEVFDSDNVTISGNVVKNVGSSAIALFFLPDEYWEGDNVNVNIRVTDNYVDNALIGVHIMVAGDRTLEGVRIHRNTLKDVGANRSEDLGGGVLLSNFDVPAWGGSATVATPQVISNVVATYNFIDLAPDWTPGFNATDTIIRTDPGEALISGVYLAPNTVVESVVDGSASGTLVGGDGADLVTFYDALGTVAIDLNVASLIVNGVAGRAAGFEHVVASSFNDIVAGDDGANVLDGGAGVDTVAYYSAKSGVSVDLNAGFATVGQVRDALLSFEQAVGSPHDDILRGTDGANVLDGRGGADLIEGRGGDDTLIDGKGVNGAAGCILDGGAGNDLVVLNGSQAYTADYVRLIGGDGSDDIRAATKFSEFVGSLQISGGAGDDLITIGHVEGSTGGQGFVSGGDGNDTIRLLDTWGGVGIWSNSQFQLLGDAGDDIFDLAGTQLNILGDDTGARIDGGAGFDTLLWNGLYNLTIGGHQNPALGLLAGYAQEMAVNNIERIDLSSTGVTVRFTPQDIAVITQGSDFDRGILGYGLAGHGDAMFVNPGTNVIDVAGWNRLGYSVLYGDTYMLYASGHSVLGVLV